jgi:cell division septation protein DedD
VEALPADLNEIPLSLQNLLLRCLAMDPEERFPDAAVFLSQLRQARELKPGARQPEDYQAWEPQKAGAAWKSVAARAGALLGRVWQVSQPLAHKVKDAAVQAGGAFLASPRRQLWGLGLAGLLILLLWLGFWITRATRIPEAVKPAPVAVAQLPATPGGGPPLRETAEPPATPAPPAIPAAPPEAAKPKEERYLVVAGSYASQKQAQALVKKLKQDNFKARIVSQTAAGKTQYVVQLGPVTGAKAAEDLAKRLKSQEKITPKIVKMTIKTKPAKPAPDTVSLRSSQ